MAREPKTYMVYRTMHGMQAYKVEARTAAEAKRLVLAGDAEAVDFWITDASSVMLAYTEDDDVIADMRGR